MQTIKASSHIIDEFKDKYGISHYYLLMHAAFPAALTPDLLYHLRVTFKYDSRGQYIDIPWYAPADILVAPFVHRVQAEVVEMDIDIRNVLRDRLRNHPRFGQKRVYDLSEFIGLYISRYSSRNPTMNRFVNSQTIAALSYTNPNQALQQLALQFEGLLEDGSAQEQVQFLNLVNSVSSSINGSESFVALVTANAQQYIGIKSEVRANWEKAFSEGNLVIGDVVFHKDTIELPNDNYLESAVVEKENANYDLARNLFRSAIETGSQDPRPVFEWARMERELQNFDQARQLLTQAVEHNPNQPALLLEWAQMERELQNFDQARQLLTQAVERDPNQPALLLEWAQMERELQNFDQARQLLTQAVERNPNQTSLLLEWAQMERELQNFDQARQLLTQAVERNPNQPALLLEWARMERELQNFDQARQLLTQAVEHNPNQPALWFERALIEKTLQQFEMSQETFRQGIEVMKPTPPIKLSVYVSIPHMIEPELISTIQKLSDYGFVLSWNIDYKLLDQYEAVVALVGDTLSAEQEQELNLVQRFKLPIIPATYLNRVFVNFPEQLESVNNLFQARISVEYGDHAIKQLVSAVEYLTSWSMEEKENFDNKSYDIYISYSWKQADFVWPLAQRLKDADLSVWIDRDLIPGTDWRQVQDHKLKRSRILVVLVTKDAIQSEGVKHEIELARSNNQLILPLVLDEVERHPALHDIQHEFVGNSFNRILSTIRTSLLHLSTTRVPKPPYAGNFQKSIANTKLSFVNVRSGPGKNYKVIGNLRDNSLVNYYPDSKTHDNWYFIEYQGVTGWISGNVVQFENAIGGKIEQATTPYDGKVAVWHWKGDAIGEHTIESFVQNLKNIAPNVNALFVKTNDGEHWQGEYDRSSMAINGPDDIDRWVNILQEFGIEFHAWCVPKGIDSEREASIIIKVCQRPGVRSMILDIEPYAGYWQGGKDGIRPFMLKIRNAISSTFHIGLTVDPRPWHYESIFPDEWYPFVGSIHTQSYWATYRSTPEESLQQTFDTWSKFGRPIIPALQGDAPVQDQITAHVVSTQRYGATGVSWWRYGVISQFQAVNTPISGSSDEQSVSTVHYTNETIITPESDGFRIGTYGDKEYQRYDGTWNWPVFYAPTESSVSKIWAEWKVLLSVSGQYEISTFVPARHATTKRARYKILGAKGTKSEIIVELDQSKERNRWNTLGIFEFDENSSGEVRVFLNDVTGESDKEIAFDALRIRRVITVPDASNPRELLEKIPIADGYDFPVGTNNQVVSTAPREDNQNVEEQLQETPVADGFDPPVGTDQQRAGDRLWPTGWLDASPFGRLYFVGTPSEAYHTGADLNWGAPYEDKGMPVFAIANGIIVFAGELPVWGNVVIIRHDPLYHADGPVVYSRYGHVQNMIVKQGQRITRGQQIAEIGDAFGRLLPHLHFDISKTSVLKDDPGDWPGTDQTRVFKDYVDPLIWIRTNRPEN